MGNIGRGKDFLRKTMRTKDLFLKVPHCHPCSKKFCVVPYAVGFFFGKRILKNRKGYQLQGPFG